MKRKTNDADGEKASDSPRSAGTDRNQTQPTADTDPIAELQRSIGNQAVQSLVEDGAIVPPDSPSEREADRVARDIVGQSGGEKRPHASASDGVDLSVSTSRSPSLQRRTVDGTGGNPARDLERRIDDEKGTGESLPESERSFFEPRFDRSFDDVTIHRDTAADGMAKSLNARAFTTGTDIFFSAGEYRPGTEQGRSLLAHELTHVVQQDGNGGAARAIQRQQSGGGTTTETASGGGTTAETTSGGGTSYSLTFVKDDPDRFRKPIEDHLGGTYVPEVNSYGDMKELADALVAYAAPLEAKLPDRWGADMKSKIRNIRTDISEFSVTIGELVESGQLDPSESVGDNHQRKMGEMLMRLRNAHDGAINAVVAKELRKVYRKAAANAREYAWKLRRMNDRIEEKMRQAFGASKASVLSKLNTATSHIVNLTDAFVGFAKQVESQMRKITGKTMPSPKVLGGPYSELLTKVNAALGVYNTIKSVFGLGTGGNFLEELSNKLSTVTNVFGTAGTLLGVAPHIGAYASYLGVMTSKTMEMVSKIADVYGHRMRKWFIKTQDGPIPFGPDAPGGANSHNVFNTMMDAKYGSSPGDIEIRQGVADYFIDKQDAIRSIGLSPPIDEGWVYDSLQDFKPWLLKNVEKMWDVMYGDLPVPSQGRRAYKP